MNSGFRLEERFEKCCIYQSFIDSAVKIVCPISSWLLFGLCSGTKFNQQDNSQPTTASYCFQILL